MVEATNKEILANKKLKKFIKSVTAKFSVDQVILFGSYAKGTFHKYSDIDCAVISSDFDESKSGLYNLRQIKERTGILDEDLQIVAFPSSVFESEDSPEEDFIKEIKKTGKIIYSKVS